MADDKALIELHVYELKVGMFVSELDIAWEKSPFLVQGFDLKSNADIKAVQEVCDYVKIDPSLQKAAHGAISSKNEESLLRAFEASAETYQQTSSLVKTMMDDIRFGNQLNVNGAKDAVSDCVDQVLESPNTMMLLTQLKHHDEYTSQHSLNVCILSILFARHLNYSNKELNDIGLCGLLHDMGKMKIPYEILNKPGRLSDQELAIMKSHTTLGRDILMSARDVLPGAVDVAYGHHEQLDGEGYPRGLTGSGISVYSRLVAIVDAYDAITSDRVYKKGRLHLQAISILTQAREKHFDASMVLKFIDCIGIYPVGNAVEMKNGEVGVVIKANPTNKTKPKILMLMDADKNFIDSSVIELSNEPKDSNGEIYRIQKVLRKDEYGLDLYDFNQQGGFEKALKGK
jgi:HD-GYP domain-containing protein (c-di-GMP phosphodiesterase class II)